MHQPQAYPSTSKVPCCCRSSTVHSIACRRASRRQSLAVAFHSQGLAEHVESQASRSAQNSNLTKDERLQEDEGALLRSQQPLQQPRVASFTQNAHPQLPGREQTDEDPIWFSPQQAPQQQLHTLLATNARGSSGESGSPTISAPQPAWFDAQKQAASLLTRKITACSTWQELEQLHQQHRQEMDFIHLCAMLTHLAHLITQGDQVMVEDGHSKQGAATLASQEASLKAPPPQQQQQRQQQHSVGATSTPIDQLPQSGTHSSESCVDVVWPSAPPAPPWGTPTVHDSPSAVVTTTGLPKSPPNGLDAKSPPQVAPPWQPMETQSSAFDPTPNTPVQSPEHASRLHPTILHHAPTPLYPPAPQPMLLAQQLQQQLFGQQQLLRPREAANCLWALTRLQMHFCEGPEGGVTDPLLHPSVIHQAWRHTPNMGLQELSSVLYSSAKLGLRPPLGYLSSCLRRLGMLCHSAQPQALANSVWALGKMDLAVPPNILRRLLQASYRDMYQFTPQGLVCLVYGFASMRRRPVLPKVWQLKLFDASWRFMRPGPPDTSSPLQATAGSKQQEGSNEGLLLSAGGAGQQGKQASVSSQYVTHPSAGTLHVTGSKKQEVNMDGSLLSAGGAGQQIVQNSVSSQRGRQQPVSLGHSIQQSEEVEQEGGSSSSRSSSSSSRKAQQAHESNNNPTWAVQEGGSSSSGSSSNSSGGNSRETQAREKDSSPVRGSRGALMGLRQRGPKLHASTLIRLLRCLVLARAFPSKPWLAECFAQVGQQAHALNAVDVVDALWALGQMRSRPPVPLLALLMERAYTHMAELPLEALVGVIWAAAQLGARPSVPWAERFLRLAFQSRDRMTPRMVANTLLSLARLNLRPNHRFVHSLLLALRWRLVSTSGGADTVQLGMALPALKHGLPAEMVPEFQRLIDVKLPRLQNPVARAVACKAWASLGLRVEET